VARLIEYDRDHHGRWSRRCGPGWTRSATFASPSEALFVHPNTFRYRLRRVREVGRLDPRQRFDVML
jgi:hypothetical protein